VHVRVHVSHVVCHAVLVGEEKEINKKLRDEMDAAFQEIQSM
jgi:hypothetical protein